MDADGEHLHSLLDQLTPEQLAAVENPLKPLVADIDGEPLTEEDRRSVLEARVWFEERRGHGIPLEEVLADFGLTLDDFPIPAADRKE